MPGVAAVRAASIDLKSSQEKKFPSRGSFVSRKFVEAVSVFAEDTHKAVANKMRFVRTYRLQEESYIATVHTSVLTEMGTCSQCSPALDLPMKAIHVPFDVPTMFVCDPFCASMHVR